MPPSFQSAFLRFHEAIKLVDADENEVLRSKRDAALDRMRRAGLGFESFNQDSYAMGTGIKPISKDYDIDVGIVFTGDSRPGDPLELKAKVYQAVFPHTTQVEWKRNCVRVQYVKQGEETFHVDLAVYWRDAWGSTYLAVGKQHADLHNKEWQPADPRALLERIKNYGQGEDRLQFKRVVRYLKRWKDVHFPMTGHAAPVGIGFTVAALQWFQPARPGWNAGASEYDDLAATLHLVKTMTRSFRFFWQDNRQVERLAVHSPVQPSRDIFEKMTAQQMKEFHERLDKLVLWLSNARETGDAAWLIRAFGNDFQVR